MTDILEEIIARKQIEIELQKAAISEELLMNNCNEPMPRISMRASLAASPYGIISEFKRRSPSKGWIKEDAQADTIPSAYEAAGASAVYVDPEAVGEVAAALENVLWDETFRSEMRRREGRRAELFSEYAVARRLIDIYSSL